MEIRENPGQRKIRQRRCSTRGITTEWIPYTVHRSNSTVTSMAGRTFGAARTGRRNVRVRTTALSLPKGREFPAAVEIFDIVGGKWRLARLLLGDTGSLPLARWRLWVAFADNRKQAPLAKADNPRTSQFRQGGVSRGDSPPWEQVPGARAGARTPGTPLLPGSTGSQSAGKRRTPVSAPQCAGADS